MNSNPSNNNRRCKWAWNAERVYYSANHFSVMKKQFRYDSCENQMWYNRFRSKSNVIITDVIHNNCNGNSHVNNHSNPLRVSITKRIITLQNNWIRWWQAICGIIPLGCHGIEGKRRWICGCSHWWNNSWIKEVIIVTAYSSDNCPVMDAAATTASVVAFKKIRRVPCASHAFNNTLKALIRENCLKYLWDSVVFMMEWVWKTNRLVQTHSVLRQRFYQLQADYPFTSLNGKVNGVAPSFVPPQLECNA